MFGEESMSRTGKYVATIVVLLAVAVGLLGFTKPGHQMLYKLGVTRACSSSDCSD